MFGKYLHKHGFQAFEPKAVLFDMDGVLYDSMKNHAKAWHESMATFGIDMKPEEAYAFEGMRGVETIRHIARRQWNRELTEEEARAMYRVKCDNYAACDRAETIPGVRELHEEIKRHGMTIGVVTGSAQPTLINRILTDFDGLVSPDVVVTALDIEHGKPAPDPYLKGMHKAGTEPWETIVVENAPLGVRAAVAAGCFTIAVNTGPLPDESLSSEGADLVVGTMDEARQWLITNLLMKM